MDALLPNNRSWADRPRVPPVLEFLDGSDEPGVLGVVVFGGFDARSIRGGKSGTIVESFIYFMASWNLVHLRITWTEMARHGAIVLYGRRRPG